MVLSFIFHQRSLKLFLLKDKLKLTYDRLMRKGVGLFNSYHSSDMILETLLQNVLNSRVLLDGFLANVNSKVF